MNKLTEGVIEYHQTNKTLPTSVRSFGGLVFFTAVSVASSATAVYSMLNPGAISLAVATVGIAGCLLYATFS